MQAPPKETERGLLSLKMLRRSSPSVVEFIGLFQRATALTTFHSGPSQFKRKRSSLRRNLSSAEQRLLHQTLIDFHSLFQLVEVNPFITGVRLCDIARPKDQSRNPFN